MSSGTALLCLPSGGIEVTLPSDAAGERQGQLSHSSDFRDGSPTYQKNGGAKGEASLPCHNTHMVDKEQDSFFHIH